jgi:uncharacterized membrane protein YqaE (UPF0057 family)
MRIGRLVLAVICPPLAVMDRGCGVTLAVAFLTFAGYVPGLIAAVAINLFDSPSQVRRGHYVQIPVANAGDDFDWDDEPRRKGAYVRLADGDVLEVIEDDGRLPEKSKRHPLG